MIGLAIETVVGTIKLSLNDHTTLSISFPVDPPVMSGEQWKCDQLCVIDDNIAVDDVEDANCSNPYCSTSFQIHQTIYVCIFLIADKFGKCEI